MVCSQEENEKGIVLKKETRFLFGVFFLPLYMTIKALSIEISI
jgi:hypothetical protein